MHVAYELRSNSFPILFAYAFIILIIGLKTCENKNILSITGIGQVYLFSNKIKLSKRFLKFVIVILDSYLKEGGKDRLGSE